MAAKGDGRPMDKLDLPPVRLGNQAWFHRYPRVFPLLLFAFGALGTLLSVLAIERAESARRDLELEKSVAVITAGLQRRATENIGLLLGAAAIFSTGDQVSREMFINYANRIHEGQDFRGSLGLGWARMVSYSGIARFEESMRQSETAAYRVWPRPAPARSYATPIVYLQPLSPQNRLAIGFDMSSDPVRRQAIETAIALKEPVLSGKVQLVQDAGQPPRPGFLLYMPVFERTASGTRQPKGLVYIPMRAEEFLASAAELFRENNLEIALFDGAVTPDALLAELKRPGDNYHVRDRRIRIANRNWILRVSDKQTDGLSQLASLTLILGSVISLMMLALGSLIARRSGEDYQVREYLTRQVAIRTSLSRELNHRVKNTLANVLSIVALTRRRADNLDIFADELTGRFRALSATHDLIAQGEWNSTSLGAIIRTELAPYLDADERHVHMAGPNVELAPNDALALGLAIHELTTNAAKYGALSVPAGRVSIIWHMAKPDLVELNWREYGGPPVVAPTKRGFGRELIEKIVASELQTEVTLHFESEGVRCVLCVPVRKFTEFTLRDDGRPDRS